jgi:hypothetical protein
MRSYDSGSEAIRERLNEPRGPGTRGARLNPKKSEQCSGDVLGLNPRQGGEGETEGEMEEGNEAGQGSNSVQG